MKYKYFFLVFSIVFLGSCKSIPKDIVLFNDIQEGTNISEILLSTQNSGPKILPDNRLGITISSSNLLDTKLLEQFNILPLTSLDPSLSRVGADMSFQDYIVDAQGEINFPVLGKLKVKGLSINELIDVLTEQLSKYISQPIVNIRLYDNFVRVLGEVKLPGMYQIGNLERYSILDAIAYAGDITPLGDKKHVKLLRENNGKMEPIVLDLTSTKLFSSPYFYLKQNDIVVVDLNQTGKKDSTYGAADSYRLSIISTAIGCVSLIASTIITIVSLNK